LFFFLLVFDITNHDFIVIVEKWHVLDKFCWLIIIATKFMNVTFFFTRKCHVIDCSK